MAGVFWCVLRLLKKGKQTNECIFSCRVGVKLCKITLGALYLLDFIVVFSSHLKIGVCCGTL